MPWLRSSANKVQANMFCCCLIVNYGVALHHICYTIVCIVLWHYPFLELLRATKSAWGFLGSLVFGPGIYLGFAGSPRDFFWVLTFGSIRSHTPLEIPSTPPPPSLGGGLSPSNPPQFLSGSAVPVSLRARHQANRPDVRIILPGAYIEHLVVTFPYEEVYFKKFNHL